jgi:hypothetical protein
MTNQTTEIDLVKLNDWAIRSGKSYALRSDKPGLVRGAKLEQSHVYEDGDRTDKLVGGTCAISLSYAVTDPNCMSQYGRNVYLITGEPNVDAACEDLGEVVLRGAKVVAALS